MIEIIALLAGFLLGWLTTGQKSQMIRLVDIFAIGPLLIFTGFFDHTSSYRILRAILIFMGAGTITYNLKNYLEIELQS